MAIGKPSVGHLKKISLEITAGSTSESMDLVSRPIGVSLIFGAGSHGLSPIESALEGKPVGDEQIFVIHRNQMMPFFGHLLSAFSELPRTVDVLHLKTRIVDVSDADDREVVRALADSVACGCDCGCSGH